MPNPINAKASQALRGQSVTVTMEAPEYPDLSWLDQIVEVDSSGKTGIVTRVDQYGVSFQVTPIQPDTRFDSLNTPGILSASETINFI
jgi:hypothetical protein